MIQNKSSFYILQVSDFHISEDTKENAECALEAISNKIKEMKMDIRYLIHTGDVINSSDIESKIQEKHKKQLSDEEYNKELEKEVIGRFGIAEEIMTKFSDSLDITHKNRIICCGNHDKARYRGTYGDPFSPFKMFLKRICEKEDLTQLYRLDDINVLTLNTNVSNDKKITCIDCYNLIQILNDKSQEEQPCWYYKYGEDRDDLEDEDKVNIIVAHQPLYDICEQIRLPYASETQTTDFLSELQNFIGGNGIYLCGDKHTSSIAASYIHDIPHYFCGHPFVPNETNHPLCCKNNTCEQSENVKIDYNLIEIIDGKIGQVKKIHLIKKANGEWECQIHPIDTLVSSLYEKCRKYIVRNSFDSLSTQSGTRYNSWVNLTWRNLFNRLDTGIIEKFKEISKFYSLFCRLKNSSNEIVEWRNNIFDDLCDIISQAIGDVQNVNSQNIINIRGDYSSGKSTFLGLLYIYLLYRYSYGEIEFIPAYFNMENDDILNKIQMGSTYAIAVKQTFGHFVEEMERIAYKEHIPVCYIIDGLDEQDIWSESSQDSIGRVALDIMAETQNAKYVMSFCQNRLARFKNTMSAIKYYEKSYVIYFNSISVKENIEKNSSFVQFVEYMISSNQKMKCEQKGENEENEPQECAAIRKLRRLSINPGFIYHNYEYLSKCTESDSINDVYKRYIDQQHQICLNTLGYNFVHYAPAMAYLFTYEGYTYERFKAISTSTTNYWERKIVQYSGKIYKAFIFIKKHKDAREYLLALHYNRELRFFAENSKISILENSIINRLIPRNISIIIRKLWRTDQNKFVIVCRNLIEKRKNNNLNINSCTLSMLMYILAYLDKIPEYIRDDIQGLLIDAASIDSRQTNVGSDMWQISGKNSERMKKFKELNLIHSEKILDAISSDSSLLLVKELLESPDFSLYNRQYMMWYYGDLTIYGENRINNLVPGEDVIYKGIDYYICFYTLYHKIYAYFLNEAKESYPLLEYDLFTICDLAYSRLSKRADCLPEDEKEANIFIYIENMLDNYITYICGQKERAETDLEIKENINAVEGNSLLTIFNALNKKESKSTKIYIHDFFKLVKNDVSRINKKYKMK